MNLKNNKNNQSQKQISHRFNCAVNLDLIKKSAKVALLKMKYQFPNDSDRFRIRKRSIVFAKNQLDNEKKLLPIKKIIIDTQKGRSVSNSSYILQPESLIQKYQKQLSNINNCHPSIYIIEQKEKQSEMIYPQFIYPNRSLIKKQRAETQYTINSSLNSPNPNISKLDVNKFTNIKDKFGSSGWDVELSDEM